MAEYIKKVDEWKQANTLEKLAPNGRVSDYDAVVGQVLESFKKFFTRDGHAADFRQKVAAWRAFAKQIEKDTKAMERARSKSSAARSRLNTTDADEAELSPMLREVMQAISKGPLTNTNTSDKLADFPAKAWLSTALAEELNTLGMQPHFQTQVKWVKVRLAKDGDSSMATEITNRKRHNFV